jgi:superfamily II DNA helicase RecQ
MRKKTCLYCHRHFSPSPYHPTQAVCSSPKCQRQRRSDYHREKLRDDVAYRDQCRDSQKKWLAKNPNYMKKYVAKRPKRFSKTEIARLLSELQRILRSEKNNVVFTLRPMPSRVWLVCPDKLRREKNILANAHVLAIHGTVYVTTQPR